MSGTYLFHWPAIAGAEQTDQSPAGNNIVLGAGLSNAELINTLNRLESNTDANGFFGTAQDVFDWDMMAGGASGIGDSLLLHFTVKADQPGGTLTVGGHQKNSAGFQILALSGGNIRIRLGDGVTFNFDMTSITGIKTFNSVEHDVDILFCGKRRVGMIVLDGVLVELSDNSSAGAYRAYGEMDYATGSTFDTPSELTFGSNDSGATSRAVVWGNIHAVVWRQEGLPMHIRQIIDYCRLQPNTTIPAALLVTQAIPSEDWLGFGQGQSNEDYFGQGNTIAVIGGTTGVTTQVELRGNQDFKVGQQVFFEDTDIESSGGTNIDAASRELLSIAGNILTVDFDTSGGGFVNDGGVAYDQLTVVNPCFGAQTAGAAITHIAEHVALKDNIWFDFAHTEKSDTSIISEWCGITGFKSGGDGDDRFVLDKDDNHSQTPVTGDADGASATVLTDTVTGGFVAGMQGKNVYNLTTQTKGTIVTFTDADNITTDIAWATNDEYHIGGFDPNGHVQACYDIQDNQSARYDKIIVEVQNGQKDSSPSASGTDATTDAAQTIYLTTGIVNFCEAVKANGTVNNIVMNPSTPNPSNLSEWVSIVKPAFLAAQLLVPGSVNGPDFTTYPAGGFNLTNNHANQAGQVQAGIEKIINWTANGIISAGGAGGISLTGPLTSDLTG